MYRPLPENLEIRHSSIHGMGLFACKPISKQTILGITHVQHKLFEHGWIRTPLGGFYNHAERAKANCYIFNKTLIDGTRTKTLITKINISVDTELTCKYTLWDVTPEMKSVAYNKIKGNINDTKKDGNTNGNWNDSSGRSNPDYMEKEY